MKAKLSAMLLAAMFIMATQPSNATIRRVGYWGTARTNVDYADLQSAHDAAAAGDTILIFPGSWSATYSKKLVTLGYGYFVDTSSGGLGTGANAGLQNITGALNISISLAAGSSNCTFEGLDGLNISGDGSGATLTGIIIRRCNGTVDMYENNTYSSWQVLQSYLGQLYIGGTGTISNLTVNNSYISAINNYGSGTATNQTGQFNNCIFNYVDFSNGSFLLKNNIFTLNHTDDANCVYQYSLFNTDYTTVPSGTGNIGTDGNSMSSIVFVGYGTQGSFSNDGRWVLKAGSPAKGTGQSGADMGIYGGANPYKLSGIPRIPAIYKLTAPSSTTSGNPYTITLSVRSNN
jgi:hypothetical protein